MALKANAVKIAEGVMKPGKFSKTNCRRVALSALKAFTVGAGAVLVAKWQVPHQFTVSTVESILFAAGLGGGGAAAKVVEVFLED